DVTELGPALKEPPDACVTIAKGNGGSSFFDFEIAEYYVDESRDGGGSKNKRGKGCWDKIRTIVELELKQLGHPVIMDVRLRQLISLQNKFVRGLANELIGFVQDFCPKNHLDRGHYKVFQPAHYPMLDEHVEWISLTRFDDIFEL